jgi:monoamine oxidase
MHDVIVIGAGFAGCCAAREVRRAGKTPLILEARDRIGGRTWTSDWDGRNYECGGNFFHWFQPHIWCEIEAANATPIAIPEIKRAFWTVDDELREGTWQEREAIGGRGWVLFNENSEELLSLPHSPLSPTNDIARFDQLTIKERMDELDLADDERAILIAELEGMASGMIDDAGALTGLRWHALGGHTLEGCQAATGLFMLVEGTLSVLQPILDAAACEVRLDTPIASITQNGNHVTVTTRAGEELTAGAVVVTVPLNVLGDISFDPPLSPAKQGAIALGQAGLGSKMMIRVKGPEGGVWGVHPDHPFSYVATLFELDNDEQIFVTFGRKGSETHWEDLAWVQRELDRIVPGYTVLETRMHDWEADEFSKGTWAIHRPGWYTHYHADMQLPEGRVILSNSDWADGWSGFVDGAVESGKRGGRWAAAQV